VASSVVNDQNRGVVAVAPDRWWLLGNGDGGVTAVNAPTARLAEVQCRRDAIAAGVARGMSQRQAKSHAQGCGVFVVAGPGTHQEVIAAQQAWHRGDRSAVLEQAGAKK
jgi:hypothetical protein